VLLPPIPAVSLILGTVTLPVVLTWTSLSSQPFESLIEFDKVKASDIFITDS